MDLNERVREVLFAAVEELNGQLPGDRRVACELDTQLMGSTLESVELVLLIGGVANGLEDAFDIECPLAEDQALFEEDGPLASLASLLEYLQSFVRERTDGH